MMRAMRLLAAVLVLQVVLAGVLIALVATDNVPFVPKGGAAGTDAEAASTVPRPTAHRFNSRGAYGSVRRQVALGPRPAGSDASRRLGERLRRTLPGGRFQAVPGGLRNVVGTVPGRDPGRVVVVGAHYDTKDLPGFVGANDGAAPTAVLTQLARTVKPHRLRSTLVFVLFDGEESPAGTADVDFEQAGLRGSKAAAPRYRGARAMVLLDFIGQRGLRLRRDLSAEPGLWSKLRAAGRRAGVGRVFPADVQGEVQDDHTPFVAHGVPAIDLIDFDYDCFHRSCDDLSHISERSLDAVGETMMELLPRL